jgi:hypothetical protein
MKKIFCALYTYLFLFCSTTPFLSVASTNTWLSDKANIQTAKEATLEIVCKNDTTGRDIHSGTAAIIKHESGQYAFILSAAHVTNTCDYTLYAKILYSNQNSSRYIYTELVQLHANDDYDLSFLRTKNKIDKLLPHLNIAATVPDFGEDIFIFGYPAPTKALIVTKGIVSNPNYITRDFFTGNVRRPFLLTDTNIFFGNSGGPVLNKDFEIIGVVHGSFRDLGYHLGFIVPAESIHMLLDSYREFYSNANI